MQEEKKKILALIANGASDDNIADKIGCSRGTVRNRILELFSESGLRSRCELVAWGFRQGYLK